MINFFIDGKPVSAQKGETILQVARKEGVYIPTMCYLSKVSPIASCRLCVVEVEGTEGFVLSCQTPPTEGIKVTTNSGKLFKERQNIMKLYDVNHPLECGVCDKSGACELQNKTLEFEVTSQSFSAKEQKREIKNWGRIQYDPNLCIMCERCVSTCNEAIGDDAIEVFYGGYNSGIVPKNSETLECTECGECIAVCPVGALIATDFKYSSNAWELKQVPSSCAHCSSACALTYESKVSKTTHKRELYRVTNNFEFSSLCGAGRFGFDFDNQVAAKNEKAFIRAIQAMEKADTIAFDSMITNEEALLLQKLKTLRGYKLVNPEAQAYQRFIRTFATHSGKQLYSADLDDVRAAEYAVVFGSRIKTDNPMVRYALTNAVKQQRSDVVYLHPMEDADMLNTVNQYVKYEVGSEEGVMALLAKAFIPEANLSSDLQGYFNELDEGYLSAESNVGEEEIETMQRRSARRKNRVLILGEDVINHPRSENIAKLAGLMEQYSDFKVLIVPPKTNSLGVALICDLDDTAGNYTLGYNVKGDFTLTALGASGEEELDMPALNQQEGTITSIDKRVVPLNAAVPYSGYSLGDLANALGMKLDYTVQLTKELPVSKGFKAVSFDSLENDFARNGENLRGYVLENQSVATETSVEEIADIGEFNGTVVYRCNPVLQFNAFTNKASQLKELNVLRGSSQFATAAKISDNDHISIDLGDGNITKKVFKLDTSLKGTIALLGSFDEAISAKTVPYAYRFKKTKIAPVGNSQ